jgi:hypothetical protein
MRRFLPAIMVVLITGPACAQPEPGEYRGTQDERMACTGDVFRLCASYIPNVTNIVACLKTQTPNLSPACRVVFEERPSPRRNARPRRQLQQTEGTVSQTDATSGTSE